MAAARAAARGWSAGAGAGADTGAGAGTNTANGAAGANGGGSAGGGSVPVWRNRASWKHCLAVNCSRAGRCARVRARGVRAAGGAGAGAGAGAGGAGEDAKLEAANAAAEAAAEATAGGGDGRPCCTRVLLDVLQALQEVLLAPPPPEQEQAQAQARERDRDRGREGKGGSSTSPAPSPPPPLPFMLYYGALLGAVRDGSVIPWTSDADVLLPARALALLDTRAAYRALLVSTKSTNAASS
jgi:hypothetical protein